MGERKTLSRYRTHGDPYSDPPRARVCTGCGLLVGDEDRHDAWHAEQEVGGS